MNRPGVIDALARVIRPIIGDLDVVIVGHSAGAAAGARLAAALLTSGASVRGLVFADGVENPTRHIEHAWPTVGALPVRMVAAPASACNREGALTHWLGSRLDGVFGVLIADSGHGDVEGEPHLVYRVACRAHSTATTRARVIDHVVWNVLDEFDLPPLGGRSTPGLTAADILLRGQAPPTHTS